VAVRCHDPTVRPKRSICARASARAC